MNNEVLLGSLIREKRLSLNLTMDYVAKQANITRTTLWSIEKGTSNCSVRTIMKVMDILGLSFNVGDSGRVSSNRSRASRTNTALDKRINRFIIFCVEQYASSVNENSETIYKQMLEKGIIDDIENDYEDLHGMSTAYLNDYIGSLLRR